MIQQLIDFKRILVGFAALILVANPATADLITVTNSGFEDTTGLNPFNRFHFGIPPGWERYDPNGIQGAGVFWGLLDPNGVDFFDAPAPEGDQVTLLFNSQREGDGEYGLTQMLTDTLQANSTYTLNVQVGNIASGTSTSGQFFNLDEFPGYRVDLLAGGSVIASDNNLLSIAEGQFAISTVQFNVGNTHGLLGQQLGIRLVNLNEIPAGFVQATSPDLEVDFDQVTLDVSSVPEPNSLMMVAFSSALLCLRRRRRLKT